MTMANSRSKILEAVKLSQPAFSEIITANIPQSKENLPAKFAGASTNVGGKFIQLNTLEELKSYIAENFKRTGIILSDIVELSDFSVLEIKEMDPHSLANVELAILRANLAVAENGTCWLPEENAIQRVLPFITQHLIVVVSNDAFVPSMHQAYEIIDQDIYGYGVFIAGPSKTADIEQSLVLGAHGPRSMTICLIQELNNKEKR